MKDLLALLEQDARYPVEELAAVLHRSPDDVAAQLRQLEHDKVILGYNAVIDWSKVDREPSVTAFIEVKLTPQRDVGFDAVAERIARFPEVKNVYLLSGDFDLLITFEERSLHEIADFIARRLAPIDGVTSTRSHFLLKAYKKDGLIMGDSETDRRLVVAP